MVRYRRHRVPDGTFFFTVTLRNRRDDALVRHVEALRASWRAARAGAARGDRGGGVAGSSACGRRDARWRRRLLAPVAGDQGGFTRRIAPRGPSPWQARFWEHTIRDEHDLRAHVDYVHINPVKHGLVACVADWPHSTFHRYVRQGRLPRDWGGVVPTIARTGEPS